jgi:hypothetical protein
MPNFLSPTFFLQNYLQIFYIIISLYFCPYTVRKKIITHIFVNPVANVASLASEVDQHN